MSSSSSEAPAAQIDVEAVAGKIHRKLAIAAGDGLAVAQHASAVRNLVRLRDALVGGAQLSTRASECILCAGVAVHRRRLVAWEMHLDVTRMLLFAALVLGLLAPGDAEDPDHLPERDERLLRDWHVCTAREAARMGEADGFVVESGMATAAALRQARRVGDASVIEELSKLAAVFFEAHAVVLLQRALCDTAPSFLSLDALGALDSLNAVDADAQLIAIASAAESEAGQQVLRDLILSFSLPREVVGKRSTLLLSRAAHATATESYVETLNAAHDAAMRGAEHTLSNSDSPLLRCCAVLAGLALIVAKGTEARKAIAFNGLVALPFLETLPPSSGKRRLALLPDCGSWVCFSVSERCGTRVHARGQKIDGFLETALLFSKSI